jgi:malate synthase
MSHRIAVGALSVDSALYDFVMDEALPATELDPGPFWAGFDRLVTALSPANRTLLRERDRMQKVIDAWHREHPGRVADIGEYRAFLEAIGYLEPPPGDATIDAVGVDVEIAKVAGPQLVVPVSNARYLLNAANARWGSLYDALYGSDVIADNHDMEGVPYDPARGAEVIAAVNELRDELFPLLSGEHDGVKAFRVIDGTLDVEMVGGAVTQLKQPEQFVGFAGDPWDPSTVLLRNHGLHFALVIDRGGAVGQTDPAGVHDVVIEAAVSTIVDFEDSVAAVNAADKVACYRNWLLLNKGTLTADFSKDGRRLTRRLNGDRSYVTPGGELVLPGRALLLVRNVGHLMTTDAILESDGREIGEGILDAVITSLCALPGLREDNALRNGRTGSIYIVKPKQHGASEVAFTVELFSAVERLLGLPENTIKLGLMDEERRTTLNLKACVAAARKRIVFVNTGFLDRSGDEIHTSLHAGPMVRKADMKQQPWMAAYEDHNVNVALGAGFAGKAQIGKGMWTMPDLLAAMLQQKVVHPQAGASTAWVPSPTAATLHALHYHRVDVGSRQSMLMDRAPADFSDLLTIPLGDPSGWDDRAKQEEVDNNVQSLLGYVVRWIDQGVGCSKVPDLHGIALMEDRATLRISSQLLANWLLHGVASRGQIEESLVRVAAIVDAQNQHDQGYSPMSADLGANYAFQAARQLIFDGAQQPNGYTEHILHRSRRQFLASQARMPAANR